MAETAGAIVVGGGIVGAAALFQLATLGVERAVLLERRRPGAGATGATGAFLQYHFCHNAPETRLTRASLRYFERWPELVGAGDCGFVPSGYLRLEPAKRADGLRERVAMLRAEGVDSRVVSPDEVARLAPYLATEGVAVAAYEPSSGYADPGGTIAGFLAAAEGRGATVRPDTTVTGIRTGGGRVLGVETSAGPIDAPAVVLTAGAGTGALLRDTGLQLPLTGTLTQWLGFACQIPGRMMTVGDGVSGSYFRANGDTVLVGLGGVGRRPLLDLETDEAPIPGELIEQARQRLNARLRGAEARPAGGRSGPAVLTPDDLPIIDRHPELDGLYFFAGDCGSSFKTGPAIGRVLAEWAVLGRPETVDVSAFSLRRFAHQPTEAR